MTSYRQAASGVSVRRPLPVDDQPTCDALHGDRISVVVYMNAHATFVCNQLIRVSRTARTTPPC